MSRYIDADVLKEAMQTYGFHSADQTITEFIEDILPIADVIEVVRCKDCKWQDKGKNECESWNMCRHNVIEYFAIYDEHFCEWGERREDAN